MISLGIKASNTLFCFSVLGDALLNEEAEYIGLLVTGEDRLVLPSPVTPGMAFESLRIAALSSSQSIT
jgi:hypothetical protein